MMWRRAARTVGLVVGAMGMWIGPADATFLAYLCNDAACVGGGDLAVADNTAADSNPVVGVIVTNGVIGGLTTAANVSQSKPVVGSAAAPQLDLGFVATGTGDVWVYASETGFTGVTTLRLAIGGTSTSTPVSVTVAAGGGSTNTNLTPGAPTLVSLGPLSTSPFSGVASSGLVGNTVNPYSLTLGVHVVQAGGTTTGNTTLAVPEPSSLWFLGAGIIGLGFLLRRRPLR